MILALLFACDVATDTGDKATDTSDTGGSTDTSGDTDTDSACATLNSGDDWKWIGECPQMRTPVVITVTGCDLALDYDAVGGMTMGMPYAGTVVGDAVTFQDGDTVTGCTGTVTGTDTIEGTCDGGCTYELHR